MMNSQRKGPPRVRTGNGPEITAKRSGEKNSTSPAPYALEVIDQKRAGRCPLVYVFAGSDGWNQADYRRRLCGDGTALVLPPGACPFSLIWPALEAPVVFQGDSTAERFNALVSCLLAAGGRSIVVIPTGLPRRICGPEPHRAAALTRIDALGSGGAA